MYTDFDYQILVTQLSQNSDSEYKDFQTGLSVGSNYMYGVRVPKLRTFAKRIAERDWQGFMSVARDNSYEEIMIQGMVLNYIKCDLGERFRLTDEFIKKIDNWAICDTFCSGFKSAKDNQADVWDYIIKYADSKKEFEKRFMIVMMMNHFLNDEYIDRVLEIIEKTELKEYYVMMAAAWTISTAFVKYREKVLALLEEKKLDATAHNKAIRKCVESYRVSNEDKALLRSLKVKKQ